MTPREIIAAAWAITTREHSIRRWAFTASLLETMLSLKLISYQFYFVVEQLIRGGEAGFFDIEIMIYNALPFWAFAAIITMFCLLVFIEFFVPHFCTGALIGLGAKAYKGDKVRGGFILGVYNFFPIFAIHEILMLSSISTVITVTSLIIRYIDGSLQAFSIGMLLFLFLFSITLRFLFSFAEEGIVVNKLGMFDALGKSFKLIVSHLTHIMFLLLLLFVISLRILVNAVMIVLIPGIIIGLGLILTTILPTLVSYTIAGIVGIGLIAGASYFFAYILAFKQNVWTIAYLELSKHKDLDDIMGGDI